MATAPAKTIAQRLAELHPKNKMPHLETFDTIQEAMVHGAQVYWLQSSSPNHAFRDWSVSPKYQRFAKMEKEGGLEDIFKKCPVGEATARLAVTREMLHEVTVGMSTPRGDVFTCNPWRAHEFLQELLMNDETACVSPHSQSLPSLETLNREKEREEKKEAKQQKQ